MIKNEQWSLVVSDRIAWARRLWPMTDYQHALGGSGGAGQGYCAAGAVGAALANRDIDFSELAQSMGVWAEWPITDPAKVGPALARTMKVVKSGAPALVDAVCQGR